MEQQLSGWQAMIDRLPFEAKIAQQFGARLQGGKWMIDATDVTSGINYMYDLVQREQERVIEPVVEAWSDSRMPTAKEKRAQVKRLMPELAHRLKVLSELHEELKHG